MKTPERLYTEAEASFPAWELVKDVVDELIDLALNYRQSGHPGGSRSKVHLLLSTMLSGAMRWDIRRPWLPFGDRFVLSAGHTVPVVYATLAALNETLRIRACRDFNPAFVLPDERTLGADARAPGHAPPPRRPPGASGDGRQEPVPQIQHRALGPRDASGRR